MRPTLRAARIRQAQVYRRLLRQVLRGIKPPAAFGGRLFIREALDLGLPETALSSGIKNSGRSLDSGWVVQRSGRRGCQFASASTEPKVIFLPLQNKRTCIAESPMLECSSTHSLRGCAPQCGYVQMQVLQNFA